MPESQALAEYYADKRQVPTNQIIGLDLPVSEDISRADFEEKLQLPLFQFIETNRLMLLHTSIVPATRDRPGDTFRQVFATRIRYATLCYGVPVRIAPDTNRFEEGMDRVRIELRRNEAAVDSELALLPLMERKLHLFGPINNPLFGTTNSADLNPARGLLLVGRLDGPSASIARRLVDLALQAEANGLWGRAYFDARGLTNGEYKIGDDWINEAANTSRRMGFDTVVDNRNPTLGPEFPLWQVALYAGWYDGNVSGPFTATKVEFMPGAFAYHLHSSSGHQIRNPKAYWVGPLLEKGATATMGCVFEPYLAGTPDLSVFFARFLRGFSLGEAAYACQSLLSWQTTVVGDPLYRPFAAAPQEQHEALVRTVSPMLEWSHLRTVNFNLANGITPMEAIAYLDRLPLRRLSAVLEQKLAEMHLSLNSPRKAVEAFSRSLKLRPTPQQEIAIDMSLAQCFQLMGDQRRLYSHYKGFLAKHPGYPDLLGIYRKLLSLAQSLGKTEDAQAYQQEIDKRSGPNGASTK